MNRAEALEDLSRKLDVMAENMGPQPVMDPAVAIRRADEAVAEFTTARAKVEASARAGLPVSRADINQLRLLKLHAVVAAMESRHAVDRSLERV
jgi:hypothetical protein